MIEAYTIGIRLALDDGVSSHIRAIRQDLTMIDRAVDTSGTRIRDLAQLGRQLVVPEQPAAVDTNRANFAPVVQQHTIEGADRRALALSGESDHGHDEEPAIPGEQTAFRIASVPEVAFAPQPPNQRAVPLAPRDEGRPVQPPAPVQANRAPETDGRSVPSRQPMNLAELGRSISPAKMPVFPTNVSQPTIETTRDWPAGSKTVMPAPPIADQVHYAPASSGLQSPRTSPAEMMTAPPPPVLNITAPHPDTVAEQGSIARAGFLASPPGQIPAQAQLPSMAPTGSVAFASGATTPAPSASETAAEPDRTKPSAASQESAHGELVIDGLAIGRWVSDHLADRVVRPHSGFSGMDPRLSPAWPGVVSSG